MKTWKMSQTEASHLKKTITHLAGKCTLSSQVLVDTKKFSSKKWLQCIPVKKPTHRFVDQIKLRIIVYSRIKLRSNSISRENLPRKRQEKVAISNGKRLMIKKSVKKCWSKKNGKYIKILMNPSDTRLREMQAFSVRIA